MYFDFRRYKIIMACDFETSTEKWGVDKALVWLWDICDEHYNHINGNTLDSFMRRLLNSKAQVLYFFRNLAYDGTYILSWLLENGFIYEEAQDGKRQPIGTFHTVISNLGQHYAYQIGGNYSDIFIMDSLKYVNMSIENSAIQYNLPIKKGNCDYDKVRLYPYTPTQEELDYIHNDTEIDMRTVQLNLLAGAVKFTQAGNARNEFKQTFTKSEFEYMFPSLLEEDKYLRKAYVGGYVQYNPKYVNKEVNNMLSLDINSMYPAQMIHRPMPYGEPRLYFGKYEHDEEFPIYIQRIKCMFSLKPNGIPTIAKRRVYVGSTDLYIKDSEYKVFELTLANPDLELFLMNYNVYNLEYIDGYKFREMHGVELTPEEVKNMSVDEVIEQDGKGSYFYDYIKKWRYGKEHHDGAQRNYDKRMQNALYGALATNPERKSNIPYLNDKGILSYKTVRSDGGDSVYLPAAIFITAWARYFLISNIFKYIDRFVYCDTDSLYLLGNDPPDDAPVHKSLYGFFKIEHYITRFKCVGCKRYIYYGRKPRDTEDSLYVTCCGADESIKKQMTFENFNIGAVYNGKIMAHNVKGGKHLYDTTYRLS